MKRAGLKGEQPRRRDEPVVPVVSKTSPLSLRSNQRLNALALAGLYLAVMSGHMSSMDGLYMVRQAYAFVFDHSIQFQIPVWTWRPEPTWNSMYGIGLSLLYVPGIFVSSALRSWVPVSVDPPADLYSFYLRELYQDPLYTVGASWVHVLVVATAAYLVARLITELGGSPRAALWGMAFYGLGSSALVYSKGDFAQPLEGLCWTAAVLAAVRFRATGSQAALRVCAATVAYAILTRPLEGMLLAPVAVALLLPGGGLSRWRADTLKPLFTLSGGVLAAVAVTLLVNQVRFSDALRFGYGADNTWVTPSLERWAGVLLSPGRGILWEFPAVVLVPLGVVALVRAGRTREVVAVLALSGVLLANTAAWYMWWGGWCWGLRLFTPAIPLLAVVAGVGTDRLRGKVRRWVPTVPLVLGFVWGLPGVVTDILGGFGNLGDGNVWRLAAYPPFGAWEFLDRIFAESFQDAGAVDIVWFRLVHLTDGWSLCVPLALLSVSGVLVKRSVRFFRDIDPRIEISG